VPAPAPSPNLRPPRRSPGAGAASPRRGRARLAGPGRAGRRRAPPPSGRARTARSSSPNSRRTAPINRAASSTTGSRCSPRSAANHLARLGLWPPVVTAIDTLPRAATAGTIRSPAAPSPAWLTHAPAARPSATTWASTAASPVAVTTRTIPSTSPARYSRRCHTGASAASWSVACGATTVRCAPASTSRVARRVATGRLPRRAPTPPRAAGRRAGAGESTASRSRHHVQGDDVDAHVELLSGAAAVEHTGQGRHVAIVASPSDGDVALADCLVVGGIEIDPSHLGDEHREPRVAGVGTLQTFPAGRRAVSR
jgi:hypothetical protein